MLKILDIHDNFFSGLIPNTLGNLRQLQAFQVAENHLTTEPVTHEWTFLSSLANCRNLKHIDVSSNPLKGVLPTYIGNLSIILVKFYASDCELKGNIPTEIGNLSSMFSLSLGNNRLSGSIPTAIGGLRNLQGLYLSSNQFRGPILESICGLERLDSLYLSSNELHGPVLPCLGDMLSLRHLSLGSNRLSSAIPSTLWNLKDILELDLSSNYLNNSQALDVGDLRSLLYLNLSRNLLTGDISSTIGGLLTLLSLDLSNNKLHGHIPESFGGLLSVVFLDLSNNNLSGFIPKSLEKLSSLNHFNVSFNRLEGEIPTNGCFPNFSSTSFMNNSALCGPPRLLLPPCKNNIHNNSKMMILHALRYGLPSIGIVILLIVLTIMYRKRPSRSTSLPIKDDLSSLKTWRRISHAQLSQATDGFEESNLLDFGIAKLLGNGDVMKQTMTLATVGYMAPEFGSTGIVSIKCDVYSYGIVSNQHQTCLIKMDHHESSNTSDHTILDFIKLEMVPELQ
ncbi:hypothetical protein V6N11_010000 [Hibiscus sabdariffa]|uniref:Serine-threonine/tyrosine-protein kinase catalytic domain-containing protein n=1 Tax=Hibiscus sabdariffa TaxID=183260 RepID=A0ABR2PDC5_9ROSI